MEILESHHDSYLISTDPDKLQPEEIHAYLRRSYWAANRPKETVLRSLRGSLCFGVYQEGRQVGLARVISDYATFAYLCDVYILEEHRGGGLGKWLISVILAHPELKGIPRWMLFTRDAHGLYQKYGFTPMGNPEWAMVKR
jgi:GNAT superfamily N-acetyltransferase